MIRRRPDNAELAAILERVAALLEADGADVWRVRAWRGGAATLRSLDRLAVTILDEQGTAGLVALPGVGKSISAAIEEIDQTGSLALLDRLEGSLPAARLFTTVPGIGPDLALRIHETLGIETLEALESAVHDGRLEGVPGFGPQRVRAVRDALARALGQAASRRTRRFDANPTANPAKAASPPVALLLEVDRAYRRGACDGKLPRIPPRRFNPDHKAWLPVLELERDGWHLTAMYSNSARAHALGMTEEWVVISWRSPGAEGLQTIVTEHRGPLGGQRVVRGREHECAAYYAASDSAPPSDA